MPLVASGAIFLAGGATVSFGGTYVERTDPGIIVVDHRADFARPERFPRRCRVVHSRPRALAALDGREKGRYSRSR